METAAGASASLAPFVTKCVHFVQQSLCLCVCAYFVICARKIDSRQ